MSTARSGSMSPLRRISDKSPSTRISIQEDAVSKATSPRNVGIRKRSPSKGKTKITSAYVFPGSDEDNECDLPVDNTNHTAVIQCSSTAPVLSEAEIFEADLDVPEAKISRPRAIKLQRSGPKCLSVRTDGEDSQGTSSGSRRRDAPTPDLLGRLSIASPVAATT